MNSSEKNSSQAKRNLDRSERIISLISGSYLLYKGLTGKRNAVLTVSGGLLLLRGATGYCPLYNSFDINSLKDASEVVVKFYLTVNKPSDRSLCFLAPAE